MSKLDILTQNWIDIVFDGRNKEYGAYDLRKNNAKNTTRAILIGGFLFIFAFVAPNISKLISSQLSDEDLEKPQLIEQEVILATPPPVDEKVPPPPPAVEPPPPRVDIVKFPPPVVKPDNQVVEEEPPTVKDLETATTGQKTMKGDINAPIQIEEPKYGEGPVNQEVTQETNEIFTNVEVLPSFPGGIEQFYKFLNKQLVYPPMSKENNIQGRVTVNFVVERDGSLTDIKVLRGVAGGEDLSQEAIRVLKKSPKWTPGIQNGRPVRVSYSVPVVFALQQ